MNIITFEKTKYIWDDDDWKTADTSKSLTDALFSSHTINSLSEKGVDSLTLIFKLGSSQEELVINIINISVEGI